MQDYVPWVDQYEFEITTDIGVQTFRVYAESAQACNVIGYGFCLMLARTRAAEALG